MSEWGKSDDVAQLERWADEGRPVLAVDLAGTGETRQTTLGRSYLPGLGGDAQDVYLAYHFGTSYVAIRAEEIAALADWLGKKTKESVRLVSRGNVGPAALHAAALEPTLFEHVTMDGALRAWADIVAAGVTTNQLVNEIHGALRQYDLPDLVKVLGDRITVTRSVDANLTPLSKAEILASEIPQGRYHVKRETIPEAYRQGKFHYLRFDGGPAEAEKARVTPFGMSDANLAVMRDLYDRHGETMIARLKEAGYDSVWITWSNGWSIEQEAEQRRQCKRIIEMCHRNGIKVTAYMSLTNMFWKEMFKQVPESREWVAMKDGKPALYGSSPNRYLADINHPGWRRYVKRRMAMALDAGVDAIFYDNMWAEPVGMRTLLSEVQHQIADFAKARGIPKPPMFCNTKRHPERIDMHDLCEWGWNEFGACTPGVWDGDWYVDNVQKIRHMKGNAPHWKPHAYDISTYRKGNRISAVMSPVEQRRAIAEAVAFGSELSHCIQGVMVERLVGEKPDALATWRAIGQYNHWTRKHEGLYIGARPCAEVLLLHGFPVEVDRLLLRESVGYRTCLLERIDRYDPSERYAAILVPPSLELTPPVVSKLKGHLKPGGKLLAPAASCLVGDASFVPYANEEIDEVTKTGKCPSLLAKVRQTAPGNRIEFDRPYVLSSLMRLPDGRRALHVVNYGRPAKQVTIRVAGLRNAPGKAAEIQVRTPDPKTRLNAAKLLPDGFEASIGDLDVYAVLLLQESVGRNQP